MQKNLHHNESEQSIPVRQQQTGNCLNVVSFARLSRAGKLISERSLVLVLRRFFHKKRPRPEDPSET